jgi:excisionase family DNA binding protein
LEDDMSALAERAEIAKDGGMGVAEAMRFLSVSRSTLYGLMDDKKLVYAKIGTRRIILRASLVKLLAESTPDSVN